MLAVEDYKKVFAFGVITLMVFTVISIQLSKNLQIENALTEEFLSSDTMLNIEEINNIDFIEINLFRENQKEIKELLKELKLKRTDDTYLPIDGEYRIVSTPNQEDQIYLFVDENVIVFPHKSSAGYKIKDNGEFIRKMELQLN